jgi:hypothetical protein
MRSARSTINGLLATKQTFAGRYKRGHAMRAAHVAPCQQNQHQQSSKPQPLQTHHISLHELSSMRPHKPQTDSRPHLGAYQEVRQVTAGLHPHQRLHLMPEVLHTTRGISTQRRLLLLLLLHHLLLLLLLLLL